MAVASPFSRPLYVMTKPAGASCNLACEYCYYLEKLQLYRHDARHVMSDEMLERFVKQYIESQTMQQVLFCWHGGETLMRPLSFYEKVVRLQRQYAQGRQIDNVIQTNGTMIDDRWAQFFHDQGWLVGVSIDGPEEFHDEYRRNKAGRPSWRQVMRGINSLNKHQVEWNAMAVVNDFNADYPLNFYQFFKDIGCRFLQFTPVVERISTHADGRHLASMADDAQAELADFSVTPEQWGHFLCTVFDQWVRNDVGSTFVQLFDTTLANWMGMEAACAPWPENVGMPA